MARYDLNADGKINHLMFRGELGNVEAPGRTLTRCRTPTRFWLPVLRPRSTRPTAHSPTTA